MQADENDAAVLDARWAEMLRQRGTAKPVQPASRSGKRARSDTPASAAASAPAKRPTVAEADAVARGVQPPPSAPAARAAPRARPLLLVSAEAEDALLAPLQALSAHREGVMDMSAAVVAALAAAAFQGDRCRWAADLHHMAAAQNKPAVASCLAGVVPNHA